MSKGADNLISLTKEYMRKYRYIKIGLEEKAIFNLRWDIMIKTKIPIVFEFQGQQHYKFTQFFHKNIEGSKKSREYDNLKRKLHNSGKVILIEVNNEDLTYSEFCDLLEPYKKTLEEENEECFNSRRRKISSRNNIEKKRELPEEQRGKSSVTSYFGIRYK